MSFPIVTVNKNLLTEVFKIKDNNWNEFFKDKIILDSITKKWTIDADWDKPSKNYSKDLFLLTIAKLDQNWQIAKVAKMSKKWKAYISDDIKFIELTELHLTSLALFLKNWSKELNKKDLNIEEVLI